MAITKPFISVVGGVQPPLPPPATGLHGYFDTLVARPEHLKSYSLRNPAMLATRANGGFSQTNSLPPAVTYTYPSDPDPRRQDAAKVVVGTGSNNLTNQVWLPIPAYTGPLVVTWDAWWGAEWEDSISGIPTYKTFMLASPSDRIWTEVRSRFSLAPAGQIANMDLRYYGTVGPGTSLVGDALSPQLATFTVAPETWTRYWVQITPAGQWTEFSWWMADTNRDPVKLLDKRLVTPGPNATRWHSFWLEYNTSTDPVKPGRPPLVSYVKNVVMLQGMSDPSSILVRP